MIRKNYVLLLLSAAMLSACSSQKPFYNKNEADWSTKKIPDLPIKYSVYLLGSLGDGKDSSNEVLAMLQNHIENADTNHSIIFLSDQVSEKGLPEENNDERKSAEKKVDEQLKYLMNDKGKILFIPGDEEFKKGKQKRKEKVLLTQSYIEKKLGKENLFLPADDCAGPVAINVTDDLLMIPLNTQWWMQDKDERNKECDFKKETDVVNELKDVLDNNQRKNILLLGHLPLLTIGHHAGLFSLKEHIFPLTNLNKNLYIPLPVIGTLYALYRGGIGTKQDVGYPRYKNLRIKLITTFQGINNLIYASGHEHNFQYFKRYRQDYIISNSSNDVEWAAKLKIAGFTDADKGFVKLTYLQNGEVWMEVFVPDKNKKEGSIVFRKRLKDNVYVKSDDSTVVNANISLADSSIVIAANESFKAGKLTRFFLGKHYRNAWTTPVKMPVIDLNTEQGGLEIIRKGGGFQTKSLRLKNPKGDEFSLRSVNKYPEKLLGDIMKNTLIADIEKDQTTTTNPYSPYVVADLCEAIGILHSNPKMVYIPNDLKLHEYRKDFANTLALFEQRAGAKMTPAENFGDAKEAVTTEKMLDKMHKDNGNMPDEYALLKVRLFDMWINDWDRHEDQWKWTVVKCNADSEDVRCKKLGAKDRYYEPIPLDRDQAFAKFDGVLPWFAGRKWTLIKFQDFKNDIRDVPGLNFNARNFDHALLTQLPKETWMQTADELKKELTDEKIDHAIHQLPAEIYKIDAAELTAKLKARRTKISSFAERYYNYLAQYVDIVGSDKKEIYEVNRINSDSTSVKEYDMIDGDKGRLLYDRTFRTNETKEVRIYAMGGEDIVNITGSAHRGIKVRIIGGKGSDSITDNSHVSGWCRKTFIYDDKGKNAILTGREAKDLTSSDKSVNDYDFFSYNYNVVAPATFFGYNTDDGVFLGGGVVIRRYGFRNKPYKSFQRIVANIALNDASFNFKYTGDFNKVFGNWGTHVDFSILAPKSTTNFFGLGNETTLLPSAPNIFYRLRYDNVYVFAALKRQFGKYQSLKIGPVYDYIRIENTAGRFLSSPEGQPYIQNFTARNYAGGRLEYKIENIDDSVLTTRGYKWTLSATQEDEFKISSLHPTNLRSEFSLYVPLIDRSSIDIRAGAATLINDFEFYQANTLGGQNTERGSGYLRGYLRGRFSGRSVAYLNAELRIKLLTFRSYLFPGRLGILGFYDEGRVWNDHETSNTWHNGYGGGFWISPFAMAIINVTYAISKEEKLYSVGLGFSF